MQIQVPRPRPYIHQGPTVDATFPVPPVTTRDVSRWLKTANDPNRLAVGGPTSQFDGPTIQATFPVPVPAPPRFPLRVPQPVLAFPQEIAAVVVVDTIGHQFDQDLLSWRYSVRQIPPTDWLPIDGPTVQATFPVPPVSQPDARWPARLDALRYVVPTTRPIEGPTVQAWFLYPVAQPDFWKYRPDPNRTVPVGPAPQFDGPTTQQTFVFALEGPALRYFVRRPQPTVAFPQEFAAVAPLDTFFLGVQPLTTRGVVVRPVPEITLPVLGVTPTQPSGGDLPQATPRVALGVILGGATATGPIGALWVLACVCPPGGSFVQIIND